MLPAKTWYWMLQHSLSSEVEKLRNSPYGTGMVLPYFFLSRVHEDKDGKIISYSHAAKKEGKIIAFNKGKHVRIHNYSKWIAQELGLEPKEA